MFKFFKEYFNLSNNEQRGVITLLLIIVLVFIAPKLFILLNPATVIPQNNSKLLSQFYTNDSTSINTINEELNTEQTKSVNYFHFNPNTATKEQLLALGFKEKTAATLINFRSKGGKFYKKEDLKKIYGVSEKLYNNIESYIILDNQKEYLQTEKIKKSEEETPTKKTIKTNEAIYININTADSTELRKVKGIGAVFATRIIKYRDLLGGFTNIEQLLEIYGMTPESYTKISPQVFTDGKIKTININNTDWNTLKKHPYINTEKAGIINKYVKTHGEVKILDDILNTSIFTQEEINKLKPYLSLK